MQSKRDKAIHASYDVPKKGHNINSKQLKPEFIPSDKRFSLEENTIWNKDDVLKPKTVMLEPKEFLRATDNDPTWKPNLDNEDVIGEKKSVENLENRMKKGESVDKPILIVDLEPKPNTRENPSNSTSPIIVGEDGRHRSYVARELGIKEIPVDVFCKKHGILNCIKCGLLSAKTIENARPEYAPFN